MPFTGLQNDFGITPYSTALGAIDVEDRLDVDVVAAMGSRTSPAGT